MKRALITGITGQDGSYLADLLLAKGYEVHGITRRASTFNTARIDHLYQLGWEPKVRFEELIQIMVDADLAMARGSIGKMPLVSVPSPGAGEF